MYDKYFYTVPADDEETLRMAFRIRYQVYCVENQFEPAKQHPDKLERDDYDSQSIHAVLIHRPTGRPAGTARLILPELNGWRRPLPIRDVCTHPLLSDTAVIPPATTCEISRFAVSLALVLNGDNGEPAPEVIELRRVVPNLCIGLIASLVRMARDAHMRHVAAVMDPALLRLLARLGIHFFPLGPLVSHHGRRQPCHSDIDLALARTWIERREVWRALTGDGREWPLNERLVNALLAARPEEKEAFESRALQIQMDLPASAVA